MRVNQKFNPNLLHQHDAVKSIVDIFKDIELNYLYDEKEVLMQDIFSLSKGLTSTTNPFVKSSQWNKNILKNIRNIQTNNHLEDTGYIFDQQPIFDIEMETGTGKTYVYFKTILELYKKYNFKKFIIIVPNKAVKETIIGNLKSYRPHFSNLYSEVNYNYKFYDSNSFDIVLNFANSTSLEILIMNIQQINKMDENNKNSNKFYKPQDYFFGSNAKDLIRKTNPILIIDEPQSTASGIKSIKAIKDLEPFFILRYSATFKKRNNNEILMYKLDAIDAYNLNLVKKIDVLSCEDANNDEIKIRKLDNKNFYATIELEVLNNKFTPTILTKKITKNSNLLDISRNDKYRGLIVEEIDFKNKKIIFTNGKTITKGVVYDTNIKIAQIRSTIEKHLDQQLKLLDKNIKVLSLFFIDKVNNYRIYNDDKTSKLGEYAIIFERELKNLLVSNDRYKKLLGDKSIDEYVKICHNGYFSMDSKGHFINSHGNGDSFSDQTTYEKIMRDKDKLLSFDEPLSFIFSHTALREGWDNPNVFQICTLNETTSMVKMHQEIGRGLRLCVNQFGERITNIDLNHLTVVTNFSYKEFVESLQHEMKENGVDFGELNINSFIFKDHNDPNKKVDFNLSKKIYNTLIKNNIIDKKTKKLNILYKNKINNLKIFLLNNFTWDSEELCYLVIDKLEESLNRDIKINNAKNKIKNSLNIDSLNSKEFKFLWEKIKYKTQYFINFNEKEFINNVIKEFSKNVDISIDQRNILITRSEIKMDHDLGVISSNVGTYNVYKYEFSNFNKKITTIVGDIERETNLRRQTIVKILTNDKVLDILQIATNKIIKILSNIIKLEKSKLIYKDIEYKLTNDFYELDEFRENMFIYDNDNLTYKVKNINKCPYEYIDVDSKIEYKFASDIDDSDIVQMFIKLPSWYRIKTPDYTYNPDWSLLLKDNRVLVVETKGVQI